MKILIVVGARPNFIKVVSIIEAIRNETNGSGNNLEYKLVHTGQHYDIKMSDIFFGELGIPPPDIDLEVGSGSHAEQTANIMIKFDQVCLIEKPDWVVVVGDVNSTLACSLVAAKVGIKIAHVEAGLRSFDTSMPEEINRKVTDAISDLLFTPSRDGNENLKNEGISESKIKFVGNVMIDTLVSNLTKARSRMTYKKFGYDKHGFVYVTLHRPSNVDNKNSLEEIVDCLVKISSNLPVIFPMHPRTKKMISKAGIRVPRDSDFTIIDPTGYLDSLCFSENARFVLTDSGGIQEETTYFQTPCLTLRPNTERPVTTTIGSNKLTDIKSLDEDVKDLMKRPLKFGNIPELWDGKTSGRIMRCLTEPERGE